MSKRGSREHYDAEFKREAVRLLLTSGKTATQLSRELGVSSWSLSRWKQEALKAVGEIEVGGQVRPTAAVEQENRQLRRGAGESATAPWSRRIGNCAVSWKRCVASVIF